ncbi:DUF924 family protein [Enterococcus sp. LJL98]
MNPTVVLHYWFQEISPDKWFNGGDAFDQELTKRFSEVLAQAARGELAHWRKNIHGRLAEIIVLDQFSRNIYRGTAQAFASDAVALVLAQEALKQPDFKELSATEKGFLYLPFMHSESLVIHEEAQLLFQEPGLEKQLTFEEGHRAILERFHRYPHRNQALGRVSTPEEIAFLKQPHSSY